MVALLLALAVPRAAHALGETTGRIEGTVTEAVTQAPVPGATLTVRGPALIGPPRTVVSGDDGHYEVVGLPSGPYDIEVSYAGVRPVHRRVFVRQGETAPLDITWSAEMQKEEVTVVQEERHLTRPDSTQTGTVLAADSESKLATGRSYVDIATQVAGVNPQGNQPSIKGANRISNRYVVDGMDVTDVVSGNFPPAINFDSINSVEIITGGFEAQYNALGGVINLVTNSGSDQLHIDASVYVNNAHFSSGTQYGPELYNGPRPFSNLPVAPTQSYQANLNIGGPIVKHKLWYNFSFEYDYLESSIPAGPPLNIQHPAETQDNFLPRLKLTWAPNERHRISISASGNPGLQYNVTQSNSLLPIAESARTVGGAFAVLSWDYFHSQNLNTNVQAGFNYTHISSGPQGLFGSIGATPPGYGAANYTFNAEQARHTNRTDNTIWYQGTNVYHNKRYTAELDPSLSLRGHAAGDHDAKVGLQMRYVTDQYDQHVPGGATYSESGGPPGEAGLCNPDTGMGCNAQTQKTVTPDYSQNEWGFGLGAFLQDRWRPFRRLRILPGIRFDWGITRNSIGQTVSNMFGVGPRLGVTYDLTGDQKTIVSAYYGRSNDTLSLTPTYNADAAATSQVYRWNKKSNGGKGGFVPAYTFGGPGGYQIDPGATPPHADEVSVSLNREIFRDSVAAINYTYKHMANIWDGVEVNQIWDPTGNRVVGYANGQKQQIFRYTTPDSNERTYQGIDFSIESRPTPNWDVYAAYTLSWLYGPGAEQLGVIGGGEIGNSAFYNPRQNMFYDGYLPQDTRHQIKLHGSYVWHGVILGATLEYSSGSPLSADYYNQTDHKYSNLRSPQGTEPGTPNDLGSVSEFRTPDQLYTTVRAAYDFYGLIHQHVALIADLFNVFNLYAPNSVVTSDIATFGEVSGGRQTPFRFQLGARYTY